MVAAECISTVRPLRKPRRYHPPRPGDTTRSSTESSSATARNLDWRTVDADGAQRLRQLCTRMVVDRDMPRNVTISSIATSERIPEVVLNHLSLIAEELVKGAFRHGFPAGRGGRIRLSLDAWPSTWELTVDDSGTVEGRRGAGMGKVRHLVLSLGGALDLPRVIGGHRCVITIPKMPDFAEPLVHAAS